MTSTTNQTLTWIWSGMEAPTAEQHRAYWAWHRINRMELFPHGPAGGPSGPEPDEWQSESRRLLAELPADVLEARIPVLSLAGNGAWKWDTLRHLLEIAVRDAYCHRLSDIWRSAD